MRCRLIAKLARLSLRLDLPGDHHNPARKVVRRSLLEPTEVLEPSPDRQDCAATTKRNPEAADQKSSPTNPLHCGVPDKWSASRPAIATRLSVGLLQSEAGKIDDPAT